MKRVALLFLVLLGSGCGRGLPGQPPNAVQKQELQKRTFYIIGDSLSCGHQLEPHYAYPVLVQKSLQAKHADVEVKLINDSIPGTESATALDRMRAAVEAHPDVVLLELGANDGLNQRPLGPMRENLTAAIKLAQANQIPVILAGMVMPLHGITYELNFASTFKLIQAETKVTLIPFLLEGVAGRADLNIEDGIHPNEKGQEVIAGIVEPYLESALFPN